MRCFCYCCWICNLVLMFMLSDTPVRVKCHSMVTFHWSSKSEEQKYMDVVKVKGEFSWKSLGTKPD